MEKKYLSEEEYMKRVPESMKHLSPSLLWILFADPDFDYFNHPYPQGDRPDLEPELESLNNTYYPGNSDGVPDEMYGRLHNSLRRER